MICHWDELESGRREAGHIAGEWTEPGVGAGTRTIGRSKKIYFRGLGLIALLDDLDDYDGEPQ